MRQLTDAPFEPIHTNYLVIQGCIIIDKMANLDKLDLNRYDERVRQYKLQYKSKSLPRSYAILMYYQYVHCIALNF